jgi:hypothetical protein
MASNKTFAEFMEICEARVPVTRQAGDFRYSGKTGEEKAERRAKVLSNSPDAKKRRQANTIRSKIKTVADRDTARASSDAMKKLYKGQQRRASNLASQLMNKEETELDEVLMVTPATKKLTKKVVKSVAKIEKPDPSDPDYVTKQRAYVKSKQQEAIDYERLRSGAEAATDRAAAVKKAKQQRQQSDAEAARSAFRTKGVPFSDAKGSGHIVNGKKVYAS